MFLTETDRLALLDELEEKLTTHVTRQILMLEKERKFLEFVRDTQTIDASASLSAEFDRIKAVALVKALS
jgi:hypothetical protein